MKKILHISKYYYPFSGGTEQIARDCVLALKGKYEQKVIAFNDCKKDANDYVDDIEIIRCGCFAKVASQSLSTSYSSRLHDVIETFCPDIIVFHYPNPFVARILLKEIAKSNIKLVLYWHLDIIKQKLLKQLFITQNKKLLNRAVKVIATSPNYIEGSEWLQSVKDKCVIIPNCINVERMEITQEIMNKSNEIKRENANKTICVAIGRHTEYKGFKYLIQASKLLDNSFKIYITGKGELTEKLKEEASGDSKIVFTGRVNDTELKALLYSSDIFCFPSITKNEAFGLALAEAMYYEKPAVTFTIPGSGVNYVCLDNENGIEVPNRDVKAYANALEKLAKDKKLCKQLGKNGKQRVVDNFLSTQFAANIQDLFGDIRYEK